MSLLFMQMCAATAADWTCRRSSQYALLSWEGVLRYVKRVAVRTAPIEPLQFLLAGAFEVGSAPGVSLRSRRQAD
jgi:hypothetical protein